MVGSKMVIAIPDIVQKEVVDAGKEKDQADAFIVENNIRTGMIKIVKPASKYPTGDEALMALYREETYDAVATDDTKLTRYLRIKNIPFILPGLIIFQLERDNMINPQTALWALRQLSEFISEDEYSTVMLLMEKTECE